MTDALDGSDPSPSAEEKRGAIERGLRYVSITVKNRDTARHLRDRKLCQFIKRFEGDGAFFTSCLEKGRKLHSVRKSIQLEQFIREAGFSDGQLGTLPGVAVTSMAAR